MNADLNQALPNQPGQSLPLKARRPDEQFDYIDANFSAGFSTYKALQVKLEKRYSHGLTLLNSFTWSKAIDNAAGALERRNGDFQADQQVRLAGRRRAVSGYDQPLNDTFSVVWTAFRSARAAALWLGHAVAGWTRWSADGSFPGSTPW